MARKVRSDKKMSEPKYQGSIPPQPELTKKNHEALHTKAAQPLKPETKKKQTSVAHLSDGCNSVTFDKPVKGLPIMKTLAFVSIFLS